MKAQRSDLETLEKATAIILQYVKDSQIKISIDKDLYWEISRKDRYDPNKTPKSLEITLGSLIDNWKEIEKIASGKDEAITYALIWLGTLYRSIGENALE